MGETPVYLKARVRTRYPARITRLPWLARPLVSAGFAKPRGLRRLTRKLAKALFFGLHGRLGLPARGEMEVPTQAGVRRIAINGANTAFLAYAQHLDAGGYEPEVSAFFDRVAAGGGVVYDVGANWGYYGVLLATNPAFSGTVHAFEAAPGTYRDLEATIDAAGLSDRVTCHRMGLSSEDGELPLVEGRHSALARIERTAGRHKATMVAVRRLDSLDLPPPDFIKIDVEGHELDVLRGGARLLERVRPVVILENWFDRDQPAATLAPLSFLSERGYDLYDLMWEAPVEGRRALSRRPPAAGDGAENTLALVPLPIGERMARRLDLNVVAWPGDRRAGITARFEAVPFSPELLEQMPLDLVPEVPDAADISTTSP